MRCRHRILALFAITLLVATGEAATFDVNSTLDERDAVPGDGNCISTPSGVCTLRAAIIEANQNPVLDSINLPAGIFTLTLAGIAEDLAVTGDLDILAPIEIHGAGTATTVVNAKGIDRVFHVLSGDVDLTLEDLTVRDGSAVASGSFLGGGVFHQGQNLSLVRVRITGNVANAAGGLWVANGSTASIEQSTFDNNEAVNIGYTNANGPAIINQGALDLSNSTVANNTAFTWNVANIEIPRCSGSGFSATNSTIANNSGSGIGSWNCNVLLQHVTVAGNSGWGLSFGSYDGSSTLEVDNSIIAGNIAPDCNVGSGLPTFQYSLDGDGTCGLSALAGDLPATDPQLLPLDDWGGPTQTMYPKPWASPVIDAGGAPICQALDQRSHARGNDGNGDGTAGCDMGAVEADDLVFVDGVESCDTGEWSSTVGSAK